MRSSCKTDRHKNAKKVAISSLLNTTIPEVIWTISSLILKWRFRGKNSFIQFFLIFSFPFSIHSYHRCYFSSSCFSSCAESTSFFHKYTESACLENQIHSCRGMFSGWKNWKKYSSSVFPDWCMAFSLSNWERILEESFVSYILKKLHH